MGKEEQIPNFEQSRSQLKAQVSALPDVIAEKIGGSGTEDVGMRWLDAWSTSSQEIIHSIYLICNNYESELVDGAKSELEKLRKELSAALKHETVTEKKDIQKELNEIVQKIKQVVDSL